MSSVRPFHHTQFKKNRFLTEYGIKNLVGVKKMADKNDNIPEGFEEKTGGDFWKPEKEGDELKGIVVDSFDGSYGKQFVVEDEDKNKHVTPSHAVLQNRMVGVEKGSQVVIRYDGEEAGKKGQNPTKLYRVFVK